MRGSPRPGTRGGRNGTYAYETRFIDGRPQSAVVVDGKASQLNRVEDAIALAVHEGDPALSRMPRMRVDYGRHETKSFLVSRGGRCSKS